MSPRAEVREEALLPTRGRDSLSTLAASAEKAERATHVMWGESALQCSMNGTIIREGKLGPCRAWKQPVRHFMPRRVQIERAARAYTEGELIGREEKGDRERWSNADVLAHVVCIHASCLFRPRLEVAASAGLATLGTGHCVYPTLCSISVSGFAGQYGVQSCISRGFG